MVKQSIHWLIAISIAFIIGFCGVHYFAKPKGNFTAEVVSAKGDVYIIDYNLTFEDCLKIRGVSCVEGK